MTKIQLEEIIRSKTKFSEFIAENFPEEITATLEPYPKEEGKTIIHVAELTQNIETFFNVIGDNVVQNLPIAPYFVWIVTNEKEQIMNVLKTINKHTTKDFGIFVFKAILNEDKIEFKCILKPNLKENKPKFYNTPAKLAQQHYWQRYFEICDEIGSDMQVEPKQQHWQYLPMGKIGVCLMLTASTQIKYIGVDLVINYDKKIFEKLYSNKEKIETELGNLEWVNKKEQKSAKVRKTLNFDILDETQIEVAVKEHIKLAENFKTVFSKYL